MKTTKITKEQLEKIRSCKEFKLLGSDAYDEWYEINNVVACVSSEEGGDGDLWFTTFGVTLDFLRQKEGKFFEALQTDMDVNHSLSSELFMPYRTMEFVMEFMSGKTNEPPVTYCGMCNFCDTYLKQKEEPFDSTTIDEFVRIVSPKTIVISSSSTMVEVGTKSAESKDQEEKEPIYDSSEIMCNDPTEEDGIHWLRIVDNEGKRFYLMFGVDNDYDQVSWKLYNDNWKVITTNWAQGCSSDDWERFFEDELDGYIHGVSSLFGLCETTIKVLRNE